MLRLLPWSVVASAAALTAAVPASAAPGDLTTIAGGPGGGLATGLGLIPSAVAVDGGRLVVADQQNGSIRAVALATGEATALAGTGAAGASSAVLTTGRSGALTQLPGYAAGLAGPLALAIAPDGDVIFSVGAGGTIRRLDRTTGTVSRIAGTGTFSSAAPGDGGPATDAGLSLVRGIAIDRAGAILLADGGSGRVRRIDPDTGRIATVVGGGAALGDGGPAAAARLSDPRQLAIDPSTGDLLIAEFGAHRVRRVAAGADGLIDGADTITSVAGDGTAATAATLGDGGPATAARLNAPAGIAVLDGGVLAIAEGTGNRLRVVRADGTITTATALGAPAGLAVRGARIYAAETSAVTRRVQEVTIDPATGALAAPGSIRTVAGNGSSGYSGHGTPAVEAQLGDPRAVTVAPDGSYYIADNLNARVRRLDPVSGRITTVVGSGTTCASAADPTCVEGVDALEAKLVRPWDVAVARDGSVYVLESNAVISRISRLDPATGRLTRVAGGAVGFAGDGGPAKDARFQEAQGIVLSADDRFLYVADTNNRRVRRIDLQADEVRTLAGTGAAGTGGDGGPATVATFQGMLGIALSVEGDVLVTDNTAHAVRRIDVATGIVDTVFAGEGHEDDHDHDHEAGELQGVARVADLGDGRLVLADHTGHAVFEAVRHEDHYDLARLSGTGTRDFSGESGFSPGVALAAPYDVAIAPGRVLLIADGGNNRIRRVELAAPRQDEEVPPPPPVEQPAPSPAPPVVAAPRGIVAAAPLIGRAQRTLRRLAAGVVVGTRVTGAARVRVELRVSRAAARRLGVRSVVLARATGAGSVRVKPSAAVRRALRRARGPLRVTVRVVASAPGTRTVTRQRAVTFR